MVRYIDRNFTSVLVLLCAVFMLNTSHAGSLQLNTESGTSTITNDEYTEENLTILGSDNWQKKSTLMYKILEQHKRDNSLEIPTEFKNAILHNFKVETKFRLLNEVDEGRGEYYIEIADSVIKLMKHDPEIISPLIDAMNVVGGESIPSALSVFSATSIPAIIEKYENDNTINETYRSNAAFAIQYMFKNDKVPSSLHNTIRQFLLKAINDNHSFSARRWAAEGLAELGDPSAIPHLREVAQSDSFSIRKKINGEFSVIYPVREKAEWAIQQIQMKQKSEN